MFKNRKLFPKIIIDDDSFDDIKNKIFNSNFFRVYGFLRNNKKQLFLITLFGILVTFITAFLPTLSGLLISNLIGEKYDRLLILVILFFVVRVLHIVFQYIYSKLSLVVNKIMVGNIRSEIVNNLLNLEIINFNDNNSGTFIDKLKSDSERIAKEFTSLRLIIFSEIGNLFVIIYLCYLDYRIGLVLCFFLLVILLIIMKYIKTHRKIKIEYHQEHEKYSSVLGEMVNGVSDIKNLDLKDSYIKKTIFTGESIIEKEYKERYYQNIYSKSISLIEYFATLIIMLLGIYLVRNNMLSISSLVIIIMYNSRIFYFMDKLFSFVNIVVDFNISCDRIFKLLNNNVYHKERYGKKYKNCCDGNIEFKNVKFKYDNGRKYVINNCNFKINNNETVILVGKSGSGKTTLLNLISRLYCVKSGDLLIDGVSINKYDERFIRENVSVISQNPYLFDMSIKDNLKLVKENITDQEIKEVCKLLCLDDYIESLPDKYDTIIGEGGIKLSIGQKQRLGIARAIVKNTKIILMDEVTSALDNETSSVIKKVIKKIQKDHTIIIVTHELNFIKGFNRILLLDDGKILGDGTHKYLLKNSELYKKLYKIN